MRPVGRLEVGGFLDTSPSNRATFEPSDLRTFELSNLQTIRTFQTFELFWRQIAVATSYYILRMGFHSYLDVAQARVIAIGG